MPSLYGVHYSKLKKERTIAHYPGEKNWRLIAVGKSDTYGPVVVIEKGKERSAPIWLQSFEKMAGGSSWMFDTATIDDIL